MVRYQFHFWNDREFAAGTIRFTDSLDPHLHFLYADGVKQPDGSYRYGAFRLIPKRDEQGQWSIEVENVDQIAASTAADVSFVVDFRDVPPGYAVVNTVNNSTVTTKKIGGEAVLQAKKLVNNQVPTEGQTYEFELLDETGTVLQTKAVFENKVFQQETQYHSFRIKKTAAENGKILTGAMFTLYQDEDCQQKITTVPANQEIPLE